MSDALRLVHTFDAPVARVFDYWTDPALLAQWAWGSLSQDVRGEVDLRVGGSYSLSTERPDGSRWDYFGDYLEIEVNRRLVYTANWSAPMGYESPGEVISVDFRADGEHTEVAFLHSGVSDEVARQRHEEGWLDTFKALAALLAEEESGD
jgi:uncharacterized protein YndB with AHSA1/START domain